MVQGKENSIRFKVRSDDGNGVTALLYAHAVKYISTDCYHRI